MKIGMYTDDEIYETLANGMLQHSMVDAMVFGIKELKQELDQYRNNWEELEKYLMGNEIMLYNIDGQTGVMRRDVLNKMKELEVSGK